MTYTLQSHEAIERWNEIAPLLERIATTDTPLSHVKEMVANREAQVWCVGTPLECVLVTKVENSRDYRYGLMWMAAGDMRLVSDVKEIVENWFRSMGCKYIQIIGRRGWKKTLPDYNEQSVNLVKTL